MPRNMQAVSELQDQAVGLLQESGRMTYEEWLRLLRDNDLADALPHLNALRKTRVKFSLVANEDGSVSHYVEAL